MPITRSADAMMLTASPKASPGVRLKESVTEGNCSWCAIASGAVMRVIWAKAESWTCVLDPPGTKLESGWIFCALEHCSGCEGVFAGTYIFCTADVSL